MNDIKKISVLLKITDQIHNGNEDARNFIEKSITTMYEKEGISFE